MKDIRIAAVICNAPVNRVGRNLARMAEWTAAAGRRGVDVVCFPELNVTGYSTRVDLRPSAEAIPGPLTEAIAAMAADHRLTVLAGIAERGPDRRVYVSHVAVSPRGLLGVYRKVHVAPPEVPVFSAGDEVPVFQLEGLSFGIQLCYDTHFPELTTRMALAGADIVFFPHASPRNSPQEKAISWMRHLPARAFDNGIFAVACNQVGENEAGLSFPGVAVVIGPDGNVIREQLSETEDMMVVDLRADALTAVRSHPMRYFLPGRRPEVYFR